MSYIKAVIWDKKTKKNKHFSVSTTNRTKEEAEQILKEKIDNYRRSNDEHVNLLNEISSNPRNAIPKIRLQEIIKHVYRKDTGSQYILLGSSYSGKSTLMMQILKELDMLDKRFIKCIMAGNPTTQAYQEDKTIPLFDGYKKDVIDSFKIINTSLNNKYRFFVCVDDIISLKTTRQIDNLMLSYRNSDISTLLSLQAPTLIYKNVRDNVTFFAFTKFNTISQIDTVLNLLLGDFEPFASAKNDIIRRDMYRKITDDYNFIIWATIPGYADKIFILEKNFNSDSSDESTESSDESSESSDDSTDDNTSN